MEYLHQHGVLHGDLKACNVLVDDVSALALSSARKADQLPYAEPELCYY
jgi:serine/threonine protein kinase